MECDSTPTGTAGARQEAARSRVSSGSGRGPAAEPRGAGQEGTAGALPGA